METAVISPERLGDNLLVLKRVHDMLDDLRKECNKLTDDAAKMLCYQWVQRGDGQPIRGKISISSPRVRTSVILPKPGTDKHEKIMNSDLDVLSLSWPKIRDMVTALNEKGEPLPSSLQNLPTIDEFKVTSRSKIGEL